MRRRILKFLGSRLLICYILAMSAFELHAQLFESFEGLSNFHKDGSALVCDGMPMPGWAKIQPPHYNTSYPYDNQGGGQGWQGSNAGRQPISGWMTGIHSVPPTDGAGNVTAYITYTDGGSKVNDSILITPQLKGIKNSTQLSFWYKQSFTNFADNLYCIISTNEVVDELSDFTIEAWHQYMPRGNMDGDFGDPWQQVTVDIGTMVPENTPIYVGFREYYNNNWYDVRAIELDVIKITDVYAEPLIKLNDVYSEGPEVYVDYDIFSGSPSGDVYIVWGSTPNPVRYGDWNSQHVEHGQNSCTLDNFPAGSKMYVRAYVDHIKGDFYSYDEFVVYAADAYGEGYIFESFEGLSNFHKDGSALVCDGMPMPGWAKIQPPHYNTSYPYDNQGGGQGWQGSNAGRQPISGWMTGIHSVPPTDGAGNVAAYITYTDGGSKANDNILVTPLLENIKSDYQLSFWYKPSFTNFADNLYCVVSTDPEADSLEDFTIEAWHRYMPRGDMDGNFGDPWQKVIVDIGTMVPEGSDIRVGFREYYNNNWYDVRAIELDVIAGGERPRSCLQFDGIDDYISLNLTNETPAYTIEVWVKPASTASHNLIVRTPGDPLTGYSRQLRINSAGQFEHYLWDGTEKTVTSSTVVTPGNWYHLTGTAADNGEIKLFINGTEEGATLPVGTIAPHGTNVLAGCATGGGFGFFSGEMEEIRFWDKVLTVDEILDIMNRYTRGVEANLEACYSLDNTSGEDLFDSHDEGENGYWLGNPYNSYVFRKQQPYYNGIDDYTFIPTSSRPAEYTVEAWVYPLKTGAQNIMVYSNGDTQFSYLRHLRINVANKFEFYNYDGTSRTLTGTTTVQPQNWYHVAVTVKNNSLMKIFVNGQWEAETDSGNTMWGTGYVGYYVGKIAALNNFNWFKGRIRNATEFDYPKMAVQIENEYNLARTSVVPIAYQPQWVDSTAPIGDSIAATQWHTRGAWNVMQNGTEPAGRGLAVASTLTAQENYIVYGDNNTDGIVTDDIPGGEDAVRMGRVWHIGTYEQPSYSLDLTFSPSEASASDMAKNEFAGATGQYTLLRRDDTTGDFSIHTSSATSVSATEIIFSGTSITEGYYTLAMTPISPPEIQSATNITAHSFTANWNAPAQAYASGYRLDVSSDSFTSLLVNNLDVGDVSSYNVNNLNPNTLYSYRVRSEFLGLTSTNSVTATVTTLTDGHIGFSTMPLELNRTFGEIETNSFLLTNTGQTEYTATNTITYSGAYSSWLSFSPVSTTVPALSNLSVNAIANAQSINPGTYWATGTFTSATADNSPHRLSISLTVSKAPANIHFLNLSQTYDGSAKPITVTTDPTDLIVDVTYNGNSSEPTEAGSYAIEATLNEVCYVGSTNATLEIIKANQSITSFTPTDGSNLDSTQVVTLASTVASGLPVNMSVQSGPAVLFDSNELRFTGGGAVQVQASQAGNSNYNPTSQINTYTIMDTTPFHYVAQNGQTAYPPYATWKTAATNIQDAINLAIARDTILVDDGIYSTGTTAMPISAGSPCRIVANKPISIESLNGPQTTIIVGSGTSNGTSAVRGAYIGNGCIISGFTFTGGNTWTTGDGWIDMAGGGLFLHTTGIVENCHFTGNNAATYGGGLYLYNGGLADRLIISNNTGGGGGICFYRAGRIQNSLIVSNYSDGEGGGVFTWWGGDVVNCTLSGNTAPGVGDGAMFYQGGGLYNSIAYGNGNSEVFFKEYTPISANNYTDDPKFADTPDANYRLTPTSPCIGGGTNIWTADDVDLDNSPRVIDSLVDIGCYQIPQNAGNALNVNPNEYLFELQNPNEFDFSIDFTIECWIKTFGNGTVFSKKTPDNSWTPGGKQLGILNGRVFFDIFNVGTYTGGNGINDGKWHHIAVACQTTAPRTIKLYVDGDVVQEVQPASWTGELNPSKVKLGEIFGCIDEFRFWKTCRTTDQIRYNMFRTLRGSETDLLFYTRTDQTKGNKIIDLAGNDNIGIPTNYNASNLWTHSDVPIASANMEQQDDINAYWNVCLTGLPWYTNGLKIASASIDADKPILTGCDDTSGSTTDQTDSSAGQRMTRFWRVEMEGNNNITPTFNIEQAETTTLGFLQPANYLLLQRNSETGNFSSTSKHGTSRTNAQVVVETYSLSSGEYTLGTTPNNLALTTSTLSLIYRRGTATPAPLYCTLSNTGGTATEFSSAKLYYPEGVDWLTITPSTGTIQAESSLVITATLNNISLPANEYSATNTFSTTDSSTVLGFWLTILKQQFTITSSAGAYGIISPLGDTVVDENDDLQFSIIPNKWYCVSNVWINGSSIGATESYSWNNILTNGIISTAFEAICITNSNIEPIPKYWLAQYDLTNNMQDAVMLDPDCDGAKTWTEYIAGTDPTNFASRFIFSNIEPIFGSNYVDYVRNSATNTSLDLWITNRVYKIIGHSLTWASSVGRIYDVEYRTNLQSGSWVGLIGASNLPATPPANTISNSLPDTTTKFYKVNVRLP